MQVLLPKRHLQLQIRISDTAKRRRITLRFSSNLGRYFLASFFLLASRITFAAKYNAATHIFGDERDYLYISNKEDFTADPVVEFIPNDASSVAPNAPHFDRERPSFLFDATNGPRVVEFYAPWCPHCKHFKTHYITFARQLTALAKENYAHVDVYAVSCTVHGKLCNQYGITSYPKILLFGAGATMNATGTANYWQLHPMDVLNRLGVQVERLQLDGPLNHVVSALLLTGGGVRKSSNNKKKQQQSIFPLRRRTKHDVFADAYLSFDFSLRTGIFMGRSGALDDETKKAFREWLDLLQASLPPSWSIQTLIKALLHNFDKVVQSEDDLEEIVDQYPAPSSEWSDACSKGEAGAGYTCGLWQLFHIMTIGIVEWNLMITNDDQTMLAPGEDGLTLKLEHAARVLRNFIQFFFGCEVCRTHFLQEFDDCAFDRCKRFNAVDQKKDSSLQDWMHFPIWLFQMHNAVNVRLYHEAQQQQQDDTTGSSRLRKPAPPQSSAQTREQEKLREWPPRQVCPSCWDVSSQGGDDSLGFNELFMYKYLRMEYWPEDFITKEYRKEVLGSAATAEHEQRRDEERISSVWASPAVFTFVPIGVVISLAGIIYWFRKSQLRKRLGAHKKVDTRLFKSLEHIA